jgi:hypothetical protein
MRDERRERDEREEKRKKKTRKERDNAPFFARISRESSPVTQDA